MNMGVSASANPPGMLVDAHLQFGSWHLAASHEYWAASGLETGPVMLPSPEPVPGLIWAATSDAVAAVMAAMDISDFILEMPVMNVSVNVPQYRYVCQLMTEPRSGWTLMFR